jgi:hypothetical protein
MTRMTQWPSHYPFSLQALFLSPLPFALKARFDAVSNTRAGVTRNRDIGFLSGRISTCGDDRRTAGIERGRQVLREVADYPVAEMATKDHAMTDT